MRERGQSLLEFALILPVLLILLMGLLDLGRTFFAYVAVTDAAAEGATYGAVHCAQGCEAQITARAQEATGGLITLEAEDIEIEPNPVDPTAGALITVTVTYDHRLVTPLFSGVLPLRAVVTERITEGAVD